MKLTAFAVSIGLLTAGCATDPIQFAGDAGSLPAFQTFKVEEERYVFPEQLPADQKQKVGTELRQVTLGERHVDFRSRGIARGSALF